MKITFEKKDTWYQLKNEDGCIGTVCCSGMEFLEKRFVTKKINCLVFSLKNPKKKNYRKFKVFKAYGGSVYYISGCDHILGYALGDYLWKVLKGEKSFYLKAI